MGRHRLIINNFFNSMIPLIKAEQKELNIILASIIEATHDLVPPIELEPLIKKLFDFFISDVLPPPQITIGLHTLYGIMERCPYCIDENYFKICEELRNYKNKSVANAARAVCNLYKEHSDKNGIENGFGFGDAKNNDTIEGIELLKKLEKKPKEYKMEYEEILSDKQLKQLKALKIKYAAELIQHKKIKDEDVIKNVPKNKENSEENEDIEELDEEDLEEIEDEEGEEIDDEEEEEQLKDEKSEVNNKKEEENKEELGLELEEIEDEEEESIELQDDELEQEEESEESFNKIQGFVNPEELNVYKRTRRERIEEIRNAQKEKFVLNKKRKRENTSKTNAEKEKLKPLAMLMPKKRLEQKKRQDKIESLNKRIRSLKQQVGRFKRGKIILKKKGGKTTKLKKKNK